MFCVHKKRMYFGYLQSMHLNTLESTFKEFLVLWWVGTGTGSGSIIEGIGGGGSVGSVVGTVVDVPREVAPPPEMGAVGAETGVVDCGVLEIDTSRLLEGVAFGLLSSSATLSSSEESMSSSSIAAAICSDVIDIENWISITRLYIPVEIKD